MSVRFIIGRAGTGKTHHCIEAMRSRLRADPVEGPRLLFLVPEQAGLQMERAIIDSAGGCDGAHRADVVSFQRLAARVLADGDAPALAALSEPARAMVVRVVLAANDDKLQYYRRAARMGHTAAHSAGLVERLVRSLSELLEEAVGPAELRAFVETAAAQANPAQAAKLHDLAIIYQDYLDYLGEDWLDPARRLELARARLKGCGWIRGAEVWVDGFASFSGQERAMLVELARLATRVDITLLTDRSVVSRTGKGKTPGRLRLFGKTTRTYADLHRTLLDAGLSIDAPLILGPEPPPRFSTRPALAVLEENLFLGDAVETAVLPSVNGVVELVQLASRRIEADYAVARIAAWVQGEGGAEPHRYRDVAVIVRDLELYHDLIAAALGARGIPYFVDRRRCVAHHPLVELLRSLIGVATDNMSVPRMRQLLKCGMLGSDATTLDELENYLIEHGVEGVDAWRAPEWRHRRMSPLADRIGESNDKANRKHARMMKARATVEAWLGPWIDFARGSETKNGVAWRDALSRSFESLSVARQLAQWERDAEADGTLDLVEEHREVWKQVCSLLDDLAFVFADRGLSIIELQEIIEAGLSQVTLGLVPPMIDQVLVGSIERSRHPNIKAALLIGCNEGVFPRPASEDSILNDDDRQHLRDGGVSVGLPSRSRVLDESMLAYIALTRPSEQVVVTWAAADEVGDALRPSPYVRAIEAALPGIERSPVEDPARCRSTWDILSPRDLTRRVAMEFRVRPVRLDDERHIRARWNELYRAHRQSWSDTPSAGRGLEALADSISAITLQPELVARYFGQTMRASVSSLEAYATCPFKFFTTYLLCLKERQERALAPVDIGLVHHAVLEDFIGVVVQGGGDLGALSDSDLVAALRASCVRVGAEYAGSDLLSSARDAYILSRSARQLGVVVKAQRAASGGGRTKAINTELAFGFERDGALPALSIQSPKGRLAELRGYIDRVDLAELGDEYLGFVIDYKRTRNKKLDMSRVYHGLSLQLLAYLLVLAECGKTPTGRPIRPGGALFVGLTSDYERVDHPDFGSARALVSSKSSKPRGLLSEESLGVLDAAGKTNWLEHYHVFLKNSGDLGRIDSSDAATDIAFGATLEHVRGRMGAFVDRILDGEVSVRPYRLGTFSPCSWCSMQAACRFDLATCDADFLPTYKRTEVFDRIRGSAADTSDAP